MKHIILGGGNLGKDLLIELNARRVGDPELWTSSRGTDVRMVADLVEAINKKKPHCVWYCVGAGSVAESKRQHAQYDSSVLLHHRVPVALAKHLDPEIKLVLFSTDYVADETRPRYPFAHAYKFRSNYAFLKAQMENDINEMQRSMTTVVRVGSLYGVHKPEQTFPGKILKNFAFSNAQVTLPENLVVPTPTRWLANVLVRNFGKLCIEGCSTREHVAPEGGVTVSDWARMVLHGFRERNGVHKPVPSNFFYDEERPLVSGLGNTLETSDHWYALWELHFDPKWYLPKDITIDQSSNINS